MQNESTELIFEVAYYCVDARRRPSSGTIERALQQVEGLKLDSHSTREKIFNYLNADTQVACRLVVFEPDPEDDPTRVGLSFEMDLPRATSFALESLPIVVQVARELKLLACVISPESGDEPAAPTVESLLIRWQEANLDEIAYQEEEGATVFRFKAVDLEALWEYQLLRRELNRRSGAGGSRAQMTDAGLWGNPDTLEVVRCSDWAKLNSIAFPEVDWVRLIHPPAPLTHGRIYLMDDLRKVIRLREQSQPIFHLLFEAPNNRNDIALSISELEPVRPRGFEPLSYQDVVDESPPFGDLK